MFDGFPYWTTRVAPGIHHVTVLPRAEESVLEEATALQVSINRLPISLVLGEHDGFYVDVSGHAQPTSDPPRGGYLFAGYLAPLVPGSRYDRDYVARRLRLSELIAAQPRKGALFGDLTKGGRPATPDELARLRGVQADGTPRGLRQCPRCGDQVGTCLDPSPVFAGMVMTVHCLCDSHNRCARCAELLSGRRLNANYYDPVERAIWHVPGFEAFGHRCLR